MELIARIHRWLGGEAADVIAALRDRLGDDVLAEPGRAGWRRLLALLNGLPRPLMALGTGALIGAAVLAPDWFAQWMETLAALPDAIWWLIGAVISLIFGARYQANEQAFARELIAAVPPLAEAATGPDAALTLQAEAPAENAALSAWSARG